MLRKVLAAGALVLAAMCLTAPAVYADVGSIVTIDQVEPADFMLDITAPAVDFTMPDVADLPASGEGDDQPIAAACSVAQRIGAEPVGRLLLRIDDPGWCLT